VGQQTALLADLLGDGDLTLAGDPHARPIRQQCKNLTAAGGTSAPGLRSMGWERFVTRRRCHPLLQSPRGRNGPCCPRLPAPRPVVRRGRHSQPARHCRGSIHGGAALPGR
jgi:hypothetical protein